MWCLCSHYSAHGCVLSVCISQVLLVSDRYTVSLSNNIALSVQSTRVARLQRCLIAGVSVASLLGTTVVLAYRAGLSSGYGPRIIIKEKRHPGNNQGIVKPIIKLILCIIWLCQDSGLRDNQTNWSFASHPDQHHHHTKYPPLSPSTSK